MTAKTTKIRLELYSKNSSQLVRISKGSDSNSLKAKRDQTWAEVVIISNNILLFLSLGMIYHSGWGFTWVVYFVWCKTPEIQQSLVHAPLPAARKTALWIKSPEQWWWLVNTVCCLKTRTATEERSPHLFFSFYLHIKRDSTLKWEEELVGLETNKTSYNFL